MLCNESVVLTNEKSARQIGRLFKHTIRYLALQSKHLHIETDMVSTGKSLRRGQHSSTILDRRHSTWQQTLPTFFQGMGNTRSVWCWILFFQGTVAYHIYVEQCDYWNVSHQGVRSADQQTVRAYRRTVGSPERITAHQNAAWQSWNNLWCWSGHHRLFEVSIAILNNKGVLVFYWSKRNQNRQAVNLNEYFSVLERPPATSALGYEPWNAQQHWTNLTAHWTVGVYPPTVGSSNTVVSYLYVTGTRVENSCTGVGVARLSVDSSVFLNSMSYWSFSLEWASLKAESGHLNWKFFEKIRSPLNRTESSSRKESEGV